MRIIFSTKDKAWKKEVACLYCKSVLEVNLEDIIVWNEQCDYGSGTIVQTGVKCPVCEKRFVVQVPWSIRYAYRLT